MINNLSKTKTKKRCAIYTRKSCEEGLEQEFNSLDAQRLSAENYIMSQASEGWVLIDEYYDDGGYSGGNLDRPALKKLFEDIKAGKIDCIVVYKIDRLTRSLFDFNEIIKILDQYNVSFVAVTQSFNTSNSMGRLMLNVLLSFAQYERELTGERIRDKFSASCQKGMWMGGFIPIGYDLKDRRLIINESEAKIIRTLFGHFVETGSIAKTFRELNNLGFRTKTWTSSTGTSYQGNRFNKSNVRNILTNELYIGKINHKGNIYDGLHSAIIDEKTWQEAQDLLTNKKFEISKPTIKVSEVPLLRGIMSCGICGNKMTPTFTKKGNRKYRYYICQAKLKGSNEECQVGRIPAKETEELVVNQILNILQKPEIISQTINNKDADINENQIIESFKKINQVWNKLFVTERARITHLLIRDLVIKPDGISINIFRQGLGSLNSEIFGVEENSEITQRIIDKETLQIFVPIVIKKRNGVALMILPNGEDHNKYQAKSFDDTLINAFAKAHKWKEIIENKNSNVNSLSDLARKENISISHATKVYRLNFVSPKIVENIVNGTAPRDLRLQDIFAKKAPEIWQEQEEMWGF